jgi:hypothetical protein
VSRVTHATRVYIVLGFVQGRVETPTILVVQFVARDFHELDFGAFG